MSSAFPGADLLAGATFGRTGREIVEGGDDRQRIGQLAQEFEAMLLLQMVRQMRQALVEEQDDDQGLGSTTMTETFDLEFARYLSQAGGVGLARVLAGHLGEGRTSPEPGVVGPSAGVEGPTSRAPEPTSSVAGTSQTVAFARGGPPGAGELHLPVNAPVSSPFGWRTDPLLGTPRFHGGIDLRAAYGHEVPTAAPGRVVFAGEGGSYGHSVVVDHGQGVRTRYAHLSAILVQPGEQLAEGQAVGRVGQTGRATGPHLHFEVWRGDDRLDPMEVTGVLPEALKLSATGDDSPVDGAPARSPSIGAADHED